MSREWRVFSGYKYVVVEPVLPSSIHACRAVRVCKPVASMRVETIDKTVVDEMIAMRRESEARSHPLPTPPLLQPPHLLKRHPKLTRLVYINLARLLRICLPELFLALSSSPGSERTLQSGKEDATLGCQIRSAVETEVAGEENLVWVEKVTVWIRSEVKRRAFPFNLQRVWTVWKRGEWWATVNECAEIFVLSRARASVSTPASRSSHIRRSAVPLSSLLRCPDNWLCWCPHLLHTSWAWSECWVDLLHRLSWKDVLLGHVASTLSVDKELALASHPGRPVCIVSAHDL